MKIFLILMATLFGLQAMDVGEENHALTARFVEMGDLDDDSPLDKQIREFVGATEDNEKWLKAKAFMSGRIESGLVRRVLFFDGSGKLITSCAAGRMPLKVFPFVKTWNGFEFLNGQESIANAYRKLVECSEIGCKESIEFNENNEGTWGINHKDGKEILAVTLMPNEVKNAALIGEMHNAAYNLLKGQKLDGFAELPLFYVSMIMYIPGIETANFGEFLKLQENQSKEGDKFLHNYYPEKVDGMLCMLAGKINQ